MIANARAAYLARRGRDYGVKSGPVRVDMVAVRGHQRAVVASFRSGSERRIEETPGLDLIRGEARFTGPKALRVDFSDGRLDFTAEQIFLDVGTRPASPPVPGLDRVPALDSTTIMELDAVPEHLLVLGGGYVGLEFGQMFRRFGSLVTVVQRGQRLLGREDNDVADAIAGILREDGITVLLATEARAVAPGSEGDIDLTVKGANGEHVLAGSHLLTAAGRAPNTDHLALEKSGVEIDEKGYIPVDERLATNVPDIYALGDVTRGPAFTHISYDDFRVLRTNLIDGGDATTSGRLVPYTVFTDPQLGRVGLTEIQARQQGRAVRVATLPMGDVARAVEVDETRGFLKAVVDAESDQVLGFAALALEGGEIMAAAQIAMMGKLPYTALRDGIFAHPTLTESFNNLFASIER